MSHYCESCGHSGACHDGDRKECTKVVTDEWGQWKCCCPVYVPDPDE